ncbi:hypothetical protein CSKR_109354 [Clonorchis sinensis]|uniref:Uncharacterized protein n=1 Tax=Clonorchis sinensis TaxID=79923 RepID=A0A419PN94_CLOSI|nr:hypothetical protein CSKR_109354 [Clonorchis sinensis]
MCQLEHEAAWCSTFSCLERSQTGDSAVFQTNSQIISTSTVDTRPKQMVHLDYKGTNQRNKQAPTWDSHTCIKSATNGRMTSRPNE